MRGQWLGTYESTLSGIEGTSSGEMMVNIDEVDGHFEAVAYLSPDEQNIPRTFVPLTTTDKSLEYHGKVYTFPLDPRNWNVTEWKHIKQLYPSDTVHSTSAEVSLKVAGSKLTIDAVTDIGITVKANLICAALDIDNKSKTIAVQKSWGEFKSDISTISKSGYLFRGQKEQWKLCTSFHRRGRYRISDFINNDVRQLHQKLSAITSHLFDLNIPDQNGAFFNLLQHHGYPTPLLDWSHSPYVAAFFAFRDRPIGCNDNDWVRIYKFNNKEWQNHYSQFKVLDTPFPHLSVMEFISIDNPRSVPQQAVTTVTNLYGIEAYIQAKEIETDKTFLEAIDIPARERDLVMADLRFMGITAGSMFPGIDGICEEELERSFDR